MKQYWQIKNLHKDKILFFRMGDFYEMFCEDAKIAAPILNIALTYRNKKKGDDTPMCGFPHHSLKTPIAKLLAAQHKVALCDQVEDPKEAKGLVKREVTQTFTPGMVYDPETLDELSANYIASYDSETVSFVDLSTGKLFYYVLDSLEQIFEVLHLLSPSELVLSSQQKYELLKKGISFHTTVFELPSAEDVVTHKDSFFSDSSYQKADTSSFDTKDQLFFDSGSLEPVGVNNKNSALLPSHTSVKRLYFYIKNNFKSNKVRLLKFEKHSLNQTMRVSRRTFEDLEIFKTYDHDKKRSLFNTVNRTQTASGCRLLKQWFQLPYKIKEPIVKRQSQVELWARNIEPLKKARDLLSRLGDLERRLFKLLYSSCHPRDFLSLAHSLEIGVLIVNEVSPYYKISSNETQKKALEVAQNIRRALVEDSPAQIKSGGFIKKGWDARLDKVISYCDENKEMLLKIEQKEREATRIPSLKISYNNVFGYYIEVTKVHKDKVPSHYRRKQTLTQAERYSTEELDGFEEKILSAQAKRVSLELECLEELKQSVLKYVHELLEYAKALSELDATMAFSWVAIELNFVKPEFVDTKNSLELLESRHPVVESLGSFVANDIFLSSQNTMLLTGPNMAGKSTLMRQVALSALLAQIGSFVPARQAKLPLFDGIYTRVGARDALAKGLSTFMVEMTEMSEILKHATERSLVIVDEIGRGTSTYDGMSLASAILEYLVNHTKAMVFFSTHYHELTEITAHQERVYNAHMSVLETNQDSIQFLYQLSKGPSSHSYGIQVASLAGLPPSIIKNAQKKLSEIHKR